MQLSAMRIEAIVDTVCPWCYIGKKRLEKALKKEDLSGFAVQWRPFLLNPDIPEGGVDRQWYLSTKFGGMDSANRVYKSIAAAGASVGIDFDFDAIRVTPDSRQSHRLIYKMCAENPAIGSDLIEDIFAAYFLNGQDIGDRNILVEIAVSHGADRSEIIDYLHGDMDHEFIMQESRLAHQLGVSGVPCFLFNGRHALSGAQEPAILQRMIRLARQEDSLMLQ